MIAQASNAFFPHAFPPTYAVFFGLGGYSLFDLLRLKLMEVVLASSTASNACRSAVNFVNSLVLRVDVERLQSSSSTGGR